MHLICTIVDAAESSLQLLATCLIRKHSPVLHSLQNVNCMLDTTYFARQELSVLL